MFSGVLAPDATGHYHEQGTYGGYAAYRRHPGPYWLLYNDTLHRWYVRDGQGNPGADEWLSDADAIETDYDPQGASTGTGTMAAYP